MHEPLPLNCNQNQSFRNRARISSPCAFGLRSTSVMQELRQQPPTTVLRTSEVSEPDDARAEGERPAQDVPREHQP